MIRYTYLNENKEFILKFGDGQIDLISTKRIHIPSGYGLIFTKIGILPATGMSILVTNPYNNGRIIMNPPITKKTELVLNFYAFPEVNFGFVESGESVATLVPLMNSYMFNIENNYIKPELW